MTVDEVNAKKFVPLVNACVAKEAVIHADEAAVYKTMYQHDFVRHVEVEYSRRGVHANTIGGYFSIFKLRKEGTCQHCGKDHLHRHLADFDYHYSNHEKHGCSDSERANNALLGTVGKRPTYKLPN